MSGYSELAALGVTTRPLVQAPPVFGASSPFRAPFTRTIERLSRELAELVAHNIVVELDVSDREIRADGLPRADARPSSPAVALAFDSIHGRQRYATGEFSTWQDNLHAIGLGLESLRRVQRYGIARHGEQYAGYRALPSSTDPADAIVTPAQAAEVLAPWGGDWKAAVKETHPDRGGDPDEYRRVIRAKELLA